MMHLTRLRLVGSSLDERPCVAQQLLARLVCMRLETLLSWLSKGAWTSTVKYSGLHHCALA